MNCMLPETIPIFPEMGQAALRKRDEDAFAAWALVRAWDATTNGGSGLCAKPAARSVIGMGLGIGTRQAQRIVKQGEGCYWRSIEGERLVLVGLVAVATNLEVSTVSRAHLVPVGEFAGRGQRRAAIVALSYRTDDRGVPTTRRLVTELTGMPATTQRRLDREHGLVAVVSTVFANFGKQPSQWYADQLADTYQDWGFFPGWGARLYRQHGSIRSAPSHVISSSAAMRRLNRDLKGGGRPAISSRGPRAIRTYFQGDKAVQSWMRDKRARGRNGSGAYSLHPVLNYSLVIGSPGSKRYHTTVLSEVRGASQLSGGFLHRGTRR